MDKIIIEDLQVYAFHGVAPEEQRLGQIFLVSLEVTIDLDAAARSDDLSKTVNYGELCEDVEQALKSRKYSLIEAAAGAVIERVLSHHPAISAVKVLLKKPWAPLRRHLKYAAVQLERQRTGRMAYLGIGSNIGDKQANLEAVVKLLRDTPGITVKTVSPFYITAPVGYADQPDFLNGAVALETTLSPDQLLKRCQELEQELKRVRTIRWGPRTIDVDILLYEDLVLDDPNLTIPHPRMPEREFVLKPLNDIAPQALHPIEKISVSQLYQRLRDQEAKS